MRAFRENIQNIIRDLASENFTLYPECYPVEDREPTEECLEALNILAESYWDHRLEEEIERDSNAVGGEVTLEDYKNWVLSKFESYIESL